MVPVIPDEKGILCKSGTIPVAVSPTGASDNEKLHWINYESIREGGPFAGQVRRPAISANFGFRVKSDRMNFFFQIVEV
jgi:hypothetical protein